MSMYIFTNMITDLQRHFIIHLIHVVVNIISLYKNKNKTNTFSGMHEKKGGILRVNHTTNFR